MNSNLHIMLIATMCFFSSFHALAADSRGTWYSGFTYPSNGEKVLAPQNAFKTRNSWSTNSGAVLIELQEDGKEVKKNDLICSFEFMGTRYLSAILRYITEMEAKKNEIQQQLSVALDKLLAQQSALHNAVSQADLNLKKTKFLAKKDFSLAKIEYDLAKHYCLVHQDVMDAEKTKAAAELEYWQARLDEALQDKIRYEAYKSRYEVLAQRPMTVRHVFSRELGRKINKRDFLQSGVHVLSLASDKKLSVEFYLDEDQYPLLATNKKINIELPDGTMILARIRDHFPFPQMLGFLYNNHDRADAKIKAYRVIADLPEDKRLQAGMDVRVAFVK